MPVLTTRESIVLSWKRRGKDLLSLLQLRHLDVLEADQQLLAGMDLEPDVASRADVVPSVGLVVEAPGAVVVGNRHAVDDRLDSCSPTDDVDVIPRVVLIGMRPPQVPGSMFGLQGFAPSTARLTTFKYAPSGSPLVGAR